MYLSCFEVCRMSKHCCKVLSDICLSVAEDSPLVVSEEPSCEVAACAEQCAASQLRSLLVQWHSSHPGADPSAYCALYGPLFTMRSTAVLTHSKESVLTRPVMALALHEQCISESICYYFGDCMPLIQALLSHGVHNSAPLVNNII